jgi:uncharacterized protein
MGKLEEHIRSILQTHMKELEEQFHVESLSIFGSVSRGTEHLESDIDILVRYRNTPGIFDFLRLKQYLESLMGRPVDLVTEGALKKQLKKKILQEAIRVA